jgi:hypothetical protein
MEKNQLTNKIISLGGKPRLRFSFVNALNSVSIDFSFIFLYQYYVMALIFPALFFSVIIGAIYRMVPSSFREKTKSVRRFLFWSGCVILTVLISSVGAVAFGGAMGLTMGRASGVLAILIMPVIFWVIYRIESRVALSETPLGYMISMIGLIMPFVYIVPLFMGGIC